MPEVQALRRHYDLDLDRLEKDEDYRSLRGIAKSELTLTCGDAR
jgi:hypothetical protein